MWRSAPKYEALELPFVVEREFLPRRVGPMLLGAGILIAALPAAAGLALVVWGEPGWGAAGLLSGCCVG